MCNLADVREWLQALLAPTVAAIAVYVAFRQHRTNQEKLRLELYEKRLAVYHALRDLLGAIMRDADLKIEVLREFALRSAEAVFLFRPDITDYLDQVKKTAIQLRATNAQLEPGNLPTGKDRSQVAEENHRALGWLAQQIEEAPRRFARYLRFDF